MPPSSPTGNRGAYQTFVPADVADHFFTGRAKKARYTELISEDEEEDSQVASSFNQRLTKFKKSPVKKGRKSSKASDDDDFIVPSDSDIEPASVKSSSSRPSSRQSMVTEDDEDEDEDEPAAKKSKPKAKAKMSTQVSESSLSFLTAAERREQDKKDEKKSTESPYSFLQDIKDVRAFPLHFQLI